jgi:hypothetical protein
MSLLTLREIDSKLKRMLKSVAELSDSEVSDTPTEITHPLHNVLFLAFAFKEENASCAVSFTIHPDNRFIFNYLMESNNGTVKVTKQYNWEQIEADRTVKLVFEASEILSKKMEYRARVRNDGGGSLRARTYLIQLHKPTPYERKYPYRHVTAAEIYGPIEYTNQYTSSVDTTAHDQRAIEGMIRWDRLANVSNFVLEHPPTATWTRGYPTREEITWP